MARLFAGEGFDGKPSEANAKSGGTDDDEKRKAVRSIVKTSRRRFFDSPFVVRKARQIFPKRLNERPRDRCSLTRLNI